MKAKIVLGLLLLATIAEAQPREDSFRIPAMDYRPNSYWQWMNGNISRKGIVEDLRYMARAGYGSAMIFNVAVGIPRGAVGYGSDEWAEDVKCALGEARRLGMKLSLHNAPGYSGTGGRWITPAESMKEVVWADTVCASDGGTVAMRLPEPISKLGFYRDIKVLAYPVGKGCVPFKKALAEVYIDGKKIGRRILVDDDLQTETRLEKGQKLLLRLDAPIDINQITVYRGHREKPLDPHDGPRDYAPNLKIEISADGKSFTSVATLHCPTLRSRDVPGMTTFDKVSARWIRITSDRGTNLAEIDFHLFSPVPEGKILDITEWLKDDGTLQWKAPAGRWEVVRIGFTTTGETVGVAPDSAVGLECDKLGKDGVDAHFKKFLTPLLDRLKPWCGNTLEAIAIDSWEAGSQDWTDDMLNEFRCRRGYDMSRWLLTLTGRTVDNADRTQRFQWDFKRTCTDLFNDNYIGRFREHLKAYGLTYSGEAYGDGNFESLEMAARQDMPMSEFWTHYVYGNITSTYLASSAAHVWGKEKVGCECFTGTPFNSKFTEHPYGMKATMDYLFASGVNELVYHCTTHQPYTGPSQGVMMTMGPFGTHLDRTSTWADLFRPLNDYASRCSYMLRQGRQVADVLYLKDEGISSGVTNYNVAMPETPYGYRWDVVSVEGLLKRISAKDGQMVTPDGMGYRLLVVPEHSKATPEAMRKLVALADSDVPILMQSQVEGYLGLDSLKDAEVRRLSETLLVKPAVWKGITVGEALQRLGLCPDFSYASSKSGAQIHYAHRSVGDDDIFFVANHRRRSESINVTLRSTGKTPELWDAGTGSIMPIEDFEDNGRTTSLNLSLQPSGSVFIVLRKGKSQPSSFTISTWVKPETFALNGRGIVVYPEEGDKLTAHVGLGVGQNGVRVYERSTTMKTVMESDAPLQGWIHVAVVYDSGLPRLYVNGKGVAKGEKSQYRCVPGYDSENSDTRIAASFEGDEAGRKIFNRALTKEEIVDIYKQGVPESGGDGDVLRDLSCDWTVSFPSWSKAPASVHLDTLQSLHLNEDFNVSHFSGTATYAKTVSLTSKDMKAFSGHRVILSLGRVENIATVSVNGSDSVVLWKAPYEYDVTGLLRKGENRVVIKVTNLYPNRIIGDESLPEQYDFDEYGRIKALPEWYLNDEPKPDGRVLFIPWKYYKGTDPLLESGLTSKVKLLLR